MTAEVLSHFLKRGQQRVLGFQRECRAGDVFYSLFNAGEGLERMETAYHSAGLTGRFEYVSGVGAAAVNKAAPALPFYLGYYSGDSVDRKSTRLNSSHG